MRVFQKNEEIIEVVDNRGLLSGTSEVSSNMKDLRRKRYSDRKESLSCSDIVRLVSEKRFKNLNDAIKKAGPEVLKRIQADMLRHHNQPSILHYACMFQPPLSTVQILVNLDEESLSLSGTNGWCPIHVACYYRASSNVIQYLMRMNPASLQLVDNTLRTPFHLLLENPDVSPEIVESMVRSYPSIVKKEDCFGRSALEYGVEKGKLDMRCIAIANAAVIDESASALQVK